MAPWMLRDYHIHYPGRKCVLDPTKGENGESLLSKMIFPLGSSYDCGLHGIGHWRMSSWEIAHLFVIHRE